MKIASAVTIVFAALSGCRVGEGGLRGPEPAPADARPPPMVVLDSLTELLGLGPGAARYVVVLGYLRPGDGGGGSFYWDPSALEHDGGLVIAPNGAATDKAGRWRRVLEAGSSLQVAWFGARCDGLNYDDESFNQAVIAAARTGRGMSLPAGKTCLLEQLNIGMALTTGSMGIAISGNVEGNAFWPGQSGNGGNAKQSTLYINPRERERGSCRALENNDTSAALNGGIVIGPGVGFVTFEKLRLSAGPNLGTCLVNISHTTNSSPSGDPVHIRFTGVSFIGNASTTAASVFLSNTDYITFEECVFAGARNDILGDPAGYLSNTRIVHSMFYPFNNSLCNEAAISLGDADGFELSDNAFEYGLAGVAISGLRGGTVRSNWFNGEGVDPHDVRAAWIRLVCLGCVVEGNRIIGGGPHGSGVDGIVVNGAGALVTGNNVQGPLVGTPMIIDGSNITVANNYFGGGVSPSQTDLVASGVGLIIAGNTHHGSNAHSIRLNRASSGVLVYESTLDDTLIKVDDASVPSGKPSLWTRLETVQMKH